MPSSILYNIDTNKIVCSLPQPKGSAPIQPLDGLLMSARIPIDEYENYSMLILEGDYLTYQAKEELRIVQKPKVSLASDLLSLSVGQQAKISIEITGYLQGEEFNSIDLSINGAAISVPLVNYCGEVTLQFDEEGYYTITCEDEAVISDKITLEVTVAGGEQG